MKAPSASGLAKALGAGRALPRPRAEADFYPTVDPSPVHGLIRDEGARLAAFPALWEAAVGAGDIARPLRAAGFRVIGSDIEDRGWPRTRNLHFLEAELPLAPALVTNPPFALVNARTGAPWIWRARRLFSAGLDYMALLLSWSWPAAAGLAPLWAAFAPARVRLMTWRVDWTGEGSPTMATAWFIWDGFTPPGETRFLRMEAP
ncbi:MAG: hypothetical protein ACE37J_13945 [Pikeienuella sp.]|uniref:hypothetical protein n=1 Tax=Pikeienuella sp. TaxID=2831957 RepID=UPI00391DCA2A